MNMKKSTILAATLLLVSGAAFAQKDDGDRSRISEYEKTSCP